VLDEFGAYPAVIERELGRYMPFLATTKILVAAVKKGIGREIAYAAIQDHAKAVALEMRQKGLDQNDLYDRLGNDERIPFNSEQIRDLVGKPLDFIGDSHGQVARFTERVQQIIKDHPEAALYKPFSIL